MANPNRPKPNVWQYIKYSYGGQLPDTMRGWVTEDLTGERATLRVVVRMFVPAFLILIPIWFLPELLGVHGSSDLVIRLSATVPILIPVVYFSHALNKIWRRHMLVKHGIDPKCLDDVLRRKNARIHAAYEERYGRRPDSDGTGSSTTI
ncbi:MAG: DUF5313 domain-containing protein [Mycobacterium sp.]|nr:DUF5313 domain-containing protein [Mycobacterium sp.]